MMTLLKIGDRQTMKTKITVLCAQPKKSRNTYFNPLWRLASKLLGVRPVNPLKVEVTSAAVELVKLGLGGLIPDEVTDGRIRAAIEKREGLGLLVCSAVTSALLSGDALEKIKRIY